jgi:hypothetical protein
MTPTVELRGRAWSAQDGDRDHSEHLHFDRLTRTWRRHDQRAQVVGSARPGEDDQLATRSA